MNKFLFSIIFILIFIFSAIFFIPINFFAGFFLNQNKNLNIEYAYLEGNILSGSVLDLYVNGQVIGDYTYETILSTKDIKIKFISKDKNRISGNLIKSFNNLNFSNFTVTDFIAEEVISLDLIQDIQLKVNINELEIKNFQCSTIKGSIFISASSIKENLNGDLSCRNGNNISTTLKNDKNKVLGTIQYFDSSVKVSISTKALPDRRLQLLTDEVSFTVDL